MVANLKTPSLVEALASVPREQFLPPGPWVVRSDADFNAALRKTLADEKVKAAFVKAGMELYPMERITPEVATAMLKSEIKRWGDVIRTNNITAQ